MEIIMDILIYKYKYIHRYIFKIIHYFLDLAINQSTTYVILLPVKALHIATAHPLDVM